MTYSRMHLDFETVSQVDLRKTGSWKYAQDPSTKVILMGYAFDDLPPRVWRPGQPFPIEVAKHVLDGGAIHAWSANFEIAIWDHVLIDSVVLPNLEPKQVFCTMGAAAYWGLPLSLDTACIAANLSMRKDKAGHQLMLRMCRPRAYLTDGTPRWWHEEDAQKYNELAIYCAQDVQVERAIFRTLPALPESEREIWLVDHAMNRRGIQIDRPLIDCLHTVIGDETYALDQKMAETTLGLVTSTRMVAPLVSWLNGMGVQTPSVDKAHLRALLDDPAVSGAPRAALEIRREAAKSSTAKLKSMIGAAGADQRVRGLMQYYGAFRTGRWAGRLCQVQNYPRIPKNFPKEWVADDVLVGEDHEGLRLKFGSPMGVVSSLLRQCFVAPPGHRLVSVDFAQVEARVIAWLADQQNILDVFESGEDIYTYAAAQIGSKDRQLGKVMTLALGFGMGWEKFVSTAKTYGIDLDPDDAREIVYAWRAANRKIMSFWYELDECVRMVIEADHAHNFVSLPGAGVVGFRMGRNKMLGHLLMKLPSGRFLCYRDARLEEGSIVYSGLSQYTRQWTDIRTYGGKISENATQAVARDLMAEAMVQMARCGLKLVASIHDEAVVECEANESYTVLEIMKTIVSRAPAWAPGLPLGGDGYIAKRYGK